MTDDQRDLLACELVLAIGRPKTTAEVADLTGLPIARAAALVGVLRDAGRARYDVAAGGWRAQAPAPAAGREVSGGVSAEAGNREPTRLGAKGQ